MNENRYYLVAGENHSRRMFHGTAATVTRAIARHEDPAVASATRTDVTSEVLSAIAVLEESGEPRMVAVAMDARAKHGWVRGHTLYMCLCAAMKQKFQDFVPELEEWQAEYWGWRWGNIGLLDDDVDSICDRIAELILCPAEVASRYWPR